MKHSTTMKLVHLLSDWSTNWIQECYHTTRDIRLYCIYWQVRRV